MVWPPQKVERGPSEDTPRSTLTDTPRETPREPSDARETPRETLREPQPGTSAPLVVGGGGDIDFSHFHVPTWRIKNDESWQLLCDDQPWSHSTVRVRSYLRACSSPDLRSLTLTARGVGHSLDSSNCKRLSCTRNSHTRATASLEKQCSWRRCTVSGSWR